MMKTSLFSACNHASWTFHFQGVKVSQIYAPPKVSNWLLIEVFDYLLNVGFERIDFLLSDFSLADN